MSSSLSNIADYIRYAFSRMNRAQVFSGHGYASSWDESVHLVLQVLELPWDFDQSLWSCQLTESERGEVEEAIRQRVELRKPLAYITRKAWFCGLPFYVDERVLVPRSPIAELIDQGFAPWIGKYPGKVMDLCTGSACIGIACAHAFEEASVDCLDVSGEALAVAQINVEQHACQDQVNLICSDVFSALAPENKGTYDLIVSNPPYVDARDIAEMPDEYRQEPMLGLASGKDGLDITRRILREAAEWLSDDGVLVVEVGNSWVALEETYPEFAFTWVEFEQGGHGVFVMTAEELKSGKW